MKQKRIVRLCTNSTWFAHSPPLFSRLNSLTIHDIRKLIKSIFMYKFTTDNLPSNFANYFVKNASVHDHATRSSRLFRPAIFKYDLTRNTISALRVLYFGIQFQLTIEMLYRVMCLKRIIKTT